MISNFYNKTLCLSLGAGRYKSCSSVRQSLIALLLLSLNACSSSSSPTNLVDESANSNDTGGQTLINSVQTVPKALLELQESASLQEPLPAITSIETVADSGLQVAYTGDEQSTVIPALSVEANWQHMQLCLQQVGVAPLVLVQSGRVSPFTQDDDVVFSMEGIPVASATMSLVPVIQVGIADFMQTGENYAYNLRSIMGRLLWLSAGLPIREYPFSCAREWAGSE